MRFFINRNDIRDVLSNIQGLTSRKTNLAITTNILIKTTDQGISITATDLETGFEGFYPAKVESDGITAINAKKLFEIVREFPDEEILINELENGWIEIGNQNVEYHLVSMNSDEFPDIPKVEDLEFFEVDSASFKKMIERTAVITGAGDDKRAHINGALLETIEEEDNAYLRLVSTDGSRLATVDYTCETRPPISEESNILIPKKGLMEVHKFLDSVGVVGIGLTDSYFIVKKDVETIIIRLLEGDFPKYTDITRKGDGHIIPMEKKTFMSLLKRMSILSNENYKSVIFDFSDDRLIVNSANPELGEAKEDLPIEFKGDGIEVAFNPRYFIETLNVIEEDNVTVHIVNEERPCLIEGEKDKTYLSVIMPMRI